MNLRSIQLEEGTIESHYGRNVDWAPELLERWEAGNGYILSEADIRLLGVRNYENAPNLAGNYWDTSTLSATKGDVVKVILPYATGSNTLTEVARFGLSLITSSETLVNCGVDLDVEDRWENLVGSGVYTKQRNVWFEKDKGILIGLNEHMTQEQAERNPLLLTKLGHPDYVDSEFARSQDEVAEIIAKTFTLGKQEFGYDSMMAQYLPDVDEKGILKTWCVVKLENRARTKSDSDLGIDDGRFGFYSVGDR